MYALSTHDRSLLENPNASWMWGSATLTIVVSSTTISWAARITKRKSGDAGGAGAWRLEARGIDTVWWRRMDFDLSAGTVLA